jgi:hypothetical protein
LPVASDAVPVYGSLDNGADPLSDAAAKAAIAHGSICGRRQPRIERICLMEIKDRY